MLGWEEWLDRILSFLPNLFAALVILLIGIYGASLTAKVLKRWLRSRKVDPEVTLLLTRITHWGLLALAILMALQQVGFKISAFLAGVGVVGFTLGFALQDVSKNLVAGILLLLMQPFDIGDIIEVQGFTGAVEDVNLRATELRTLDGRLVLIPNADVFTSAIVNFTRTPRRRVSVDVGVAYDSDLKQVRQVALDAVQRLPFVLDDPAPFVWFHTFGDSSINLTLYFWVEANTILPPEAQSQALQAIFDAFNAAGIEIPFPIRTVYLHSSTQEKDP